MKVQFKFFSLETAFYFEVKIRCRKFYHQIKLKNKVIHSNLINFLVIHTYNFSLIYSQNDDIMNALHY